MPTGKLVLFKKSTRAEGQYYGWLIDDEVGYYDRDQNIFFDERGVNCDFAVMNPGRRVSFDYSKMAPKRPGYRPKAVNIEPLED